MVYATVKERLAASPNIPFKFEKTPPGKLNLESESFATYPRYPVTLFEPYTAEDTTRVLDKIFTAACLVARDVRTETTLLYWAARDWPVVL